MISRRLGDNTLLKGENRQVSPLASGVTWHHIKLTALLASLAPEACRFQTPASG